jgi:AcrR family transcriptional regulator
MALDPDVVVDGRRVRGARTRRAILGRATSLASAEGLEAVSLQRLASDLGISKSGLFAHFGSKEELQLATVEEAGRIFTDEVLRPGLVPPAGLRRIWALCEAYFSYIERDVFPGGCFFEAALAEFDSRPGPVRDLIVQHRDYWCASLVRAVRDAQAAGEVREDADPQQVAWELACLLDGVNRLHVTHPYQPAAERARRAIQDRLDRIATA